MHAHTAATPTPPAQDVFLEKHAIKLGFMSAFVKAAAAALQEVPSVNAVIDGDEIVYRDYYDISIAVATPKGLVVPVLRKADELSFAEVEKVRAAACRPGGGRGGRWVGGGGMGCALAGNTTASASVASAGR